MASRFSLNLEQSVSRSGTQLLADCAVVLGGEVSSFQDPVFSLFPGGLEVFPFLPDSQVFWFCFFLPRETR